MNHTMVSREDLYQILVSLLPEQPKDIYDDSTFSISLGLDSLDFLEYQNAIEDRLNTVFPDDFFDDTLTVGSLLDKLGSHLNQPPEEVINHGTQQSENPVQAQRQGRKEEIVSENSIKGMGDSGYSTFPTPIPNSEGEPRL